MIFPFFTKTAPTIGFGWARAALRVASVRARSIQPSSFTAVRVILECSSALGSRLAASRPPLQIQNLKEPALRRSIKERVDVGLGIEWDQVVDFFAGAYEADWQIQFAGNGYDDAAFGGAVEFGEHDAGDSGMAPEFAGLVQAVLSGGGVEDEEHVMRRAGNYFGGGAF